MACRIMPPTPTDIYIPVSQTKQFLALEVGPGVDKLDFSESSDSGMPTDRLELWRGVQKFLPLVASSGSPRGTSPVCSGTT